MISHNQSPGKSVQNLMHLLNDGMSILKRGIVTMPVSTHRNFALCLHLNNWHCPSELPLQQSQSFEDLSLWMPKDSMLTSKPNSKRIPFPQNTSAFSQTCTGPLTPMVYFSTLVRFMS